MMDRYGMRLKLNKIWDVAYPLVFFMLVLVMCSIGALIIGGVFLGIYSTDVLFRLYPVIALLISIAFYSITIVVQWRTYKKDDFRFGERKNTWKPWQILLAALAAAVLSTLLNALILISPLPNLFPGYYEAAAVSFAGQPPILLIIATVLLGPAAEEIIFRGLVYERLKHYVKLPLAILISAALFGIYHGNVIQFIYATIMGTILAFYYEKSGGILAPVAAHMMMNAFGIPSFL